MYGAWIQSIRDGKGSRIADAGCKMQDVRCTMQGEVGTAAGWSAGMEFSEYNQPYSRKGTKLCVLPIKLMDPILNYGVGCVGMEPVPRTPKPAPS